MNRTEVLEQIRPILSIQVRPLSVEPRIRAEGERLYIQPSRSAKAIPFAAEGAAALLKATGVTQELAQRLKPGTIERVLIEALGNRRSPLALLVQEEQVHDLVPSRQYHPVPAERVLETVERVVPQADFHRILTLPHHTVQVETVGAEEKAVTPGDLVRAGVLVRFSPIGATTPTIQSYVLRLACTNGATSTALVRDFAFDGGGERGEGGDGRLWNWVRKSAREAYASLEEIIAQWRSMAQEQLAPSDRAMILESLLKQARLRGEAADAVRAQALENPPQTAYDAMNLITYAASHIIAEAAAIVRAQATAARFVGEMAHQRTCPICHRTR